MNEPPNEKAPPLVRATRPQSEFLSREALEVLEGAKSDDSGQPVKGVVLNCGVVVWVDADDYDHATKLNWYVRDVGKAICIMETHGLTSIAEWIIGRKEGLVVDHRNGDPRDNRRANLRFVTRRQNNFNQVRRTNRSVCGYLGVRKSYRRYYGVVSAAEERRLTSRFSDATSAAVARDDLAFEMHGEFGVYNFPREELPEGTTRLWASPNYLAEIRVIIARPRPFGGAA